MDIAYSSAVASCNLRFNVDITTSPQNHTKVFITLGLCFRSSLNIYVYVDMYVCIEVQR